MEKILDTTKPCYLHVSLPFVISRVHYNYESCVPKNNRLCENFLSYLEWPQTWQLQDGDMGSLSYLQDFEQPTKMTPLGDEHCHETISGGLVIFLTTVGRQGTPSYQLGFHLHLEAVTPLQNLTNLKDRIKTRPAFCFISLNANNSYCNLTHQ